jgi:hypothetical protein
MQMHEHFEELCALAVISQLSAEEHQELLTHLRVCDRCKQTEDEFALILDQLPAAAPPDVSGDTEQLLGESYFQNFVNRAVAEGVRFTDQVRETKRPRSLRFAKPRWYPVALVAAMLLLLAALLGSVFIVGWVRARVTNLPTSGNVANKTEQVASNIAHQGSSPQDSDRISSRVVAPGPAEIRLQSLEQQLVNLAKEKEQMEKVAEQLRQELSTVRAHSDQNDQALSKATTEIESLKNDQLQLTADLTASTARSAELSEQLAAQASAVEREHQLSAASRDVRELMGARSLHMIDVYDWDGRGKRDKSFGRVFFTEGKSLIFYAFDLTQKTSGSKLTFQAWGQREGTEHGAKNLGVFHIDDHAQKRWVLRVDDPKLLSSIDSVFVTVEPSPGREKPGGKKLLYAYLGTQANHP